MADDVDLVLQSVRGIGQSARGLGETVRGLREEDERRQEIERRREAERVREERVEALVGDIGSAQKDLEELGPLATQEDFASATAPLARRAAELGQPQLLKSLDPFQEAITQRAKAGRAEIAAGRTAQEKAESKKLKAEQTKFQRISTIKKRLDPVNKTTRQARQSFNTIKEAAKKGTPAGDVALITGFAKSIDQGARVTDQDFKNAERARKTFEKLEAGTLPGQEGPVVIPAFVKSILTRLDPEKGTKLTQEQRDEFVGAAEVGFRSALEEQDRAEQEAFQFATQFGLTPQDIVKKTAREDLDILDEAERKRQEAQKDLIDEEGKTAGQKQGSQNAGQSNLKTISRQQADIMINNPANQQAFEQAVQAWEAANGRPMTPEEKDDRIDQILLQKGLIIQE